MSLLMDALRRAEAERKLQAARGNSTQQESPNPPASNPLFESVLDDSTVISDAVVGTLSDLKLDLENEASQFSLEPLEPGLAEQHADIQAGREAQTEITLGMRSERAEQTGTMPSARGLSSDMRSYFDQSQSVEIPRAAIATDSTLEDAAAHTLVDAQTVFTAGERPRRSGVAIAAFGSAVVLIIAIGVVVIFYARQSAAPRIMPSPTVASGVETISSPNVPVTPLQSQTAPAPGELQRIEVRPADVPAQEQPVPPAASALVGVDTVPPSPATASAAAPSEPPSTTATEVPPQELLPSPAVSTPSVSEAAPAAATSPSIAAPRGTLGESAPATAPVADVGVGEVRIAHSRPAHTVNASIARAYEAFQRGDVEAAHALYSAALVSQPDSRDALLGLGAAALKRGNLAEAYQHYVAVLERYPNDVVASAALFSLSAEGGAASAARLKLLQDKHPDLPVVHFALGNWYARQGRWADAQRSYFDAVRLDDANADYAFNLAVSLDRLNQGQAALGYYQKSITLADAAGATFNSADALARISSLSAANAR